MSLLSSSAASGDVHRAEVAFASEGVAAGWTCDCQGSATRVRTTLLDLAARQVVLRRLASLEGGSLLVDDGSELLSIGQATSDAPPLVTVCHPRLWRRLALGGSLAAAECYLQGDWQCDDLLAVLRIFARNARAAHDINSGLPKLATPWNWFSRLATRNNRAGSRRNIAAHYDLSNDFFALMLDETMAYSANIFASPEVSLHAAALAKYDHVCQKLELSPRDHLLEIGCGWGGFALHAAEHYGCRVTATTISQAQFEFAERRLHERGLAERVTLVRQDYRDLAGQFDKLVSIEMIEAVGERFLAGYFRQCSRMLKPQGKMLLQAITIPDHLYPRYRRGVDFVQQYIFPGGFLPSVSAITDALARFSDLQLFHFEEMSSHYATTLAHWRSNFWRNIDSVRRLKFDERFLRMWHYYLCFCEAGFRERATSVGQWLLAK
jgi:cyclopropane-fatty-acyl-phospholipid synthase